LKGLGRVRLSFATWAPKRAGSRTPQDRPKPDHALKHEIHHSPRRPP
jgi:hypothetical protein